MMTPYHLHIYYFRVVLEILCNNQSAKVLYLYVIINIDAHYYIELFGSMMMVMLKTELWIFYTRYMERLGEQQVQYNGFFNHISLIFMHVGCAGIHKTNGTTGS